MPATVQEFKQELQSLPAPQRAELAHFLIESLDDEHDLDAEAAWDKEIEFRLTEIQSGKAQGIPAEEVFAKIREKYSGSP
ncbi:MAG: addiction module component [Gemmataceae bacterium]|nr:addiction module component [Gemmataceae bacterium]